MRTEDLLALDHEAGMRLIDFAETPRTDDWTLRSALVRYAQVAPVAASAVLELVRRTDGALGPFVRPLERATVRELATDDHGTPRLVELLEPAAILDQLAEELVAWAADPSRDPPGAAVEQLGGRAFDRLAQLGVPRETRPPRRAGGRRNG